MNYRLFRDRNEAIIFFLLFLSFSYFYQGGFSNQNSRMNLSLALSYQGTYKIDAFHKNTVDKASQKGHYYSEKAPGLSYSALPIVFLLTKIVSFKKFIANQFWGNTFLYLVTVLIVSLFSAISALFYYRLILLLLGKEAYDNNYSVAVGVISAFTSTLMFVYSTVFIGHQFVASLTIFILYYFYRSFFIEHRKVMKKDLFLFYFFAFWMVFYEYPSLAYITPFVLYSLFIRGKQAFSLAFLAGLLPLLFFLGHNTLSFGSPFELGYGNMEESPFIVHQKGFLGIAAINWDGLFALLFSFYRGIFIYCPVLVLSSIGFMHFVKERKLDLRFFLLIISGVVLHLVLISCFDYWQGGACFGPRYLVVIIPSLFLGVFYFFLKLNKYWPLLVIFVGASYLINLAGVAVDVFPSESLDNPLVDHYWQHVKKGHVSINPQNFHTAYYANLDQPFNRGDFTSGAVNWGELIGLREILSIVPLLLLHLGTIGYLLRQSNKKIS